MAWYYNNSDRSKHNMYKPKTLSHFVEHGPQCTVNGFACGILKSE